jgi:hypothetical protein
MDTLVNGGTLAFGELRFDIGARRIVRMSATGCVPVALGSRALDILSCPDTTAWRAGDQGRDHAGGLVERRGGR